MFKLVVRKRGKPGHTIVNVFSSPVSYQSLGTFVILPTLSMLPGKSRDIPKIRPTSLYLILDVLAMQKNTAQVS